MASGPGEETELPKVTEQVSRTAPLCHFYSVTSCFASHLTQLQVVPMLGDFKAGHSISASRGVCDRGQFLLLVLFQSHHRQTLTGSSSQVQLIMGRHSSCFTARGGKRGPRSHAGRSVQTSSRPGSLNAPSRFLQLPRCRPVTGSGQRGVTAPAASPCAHCLVLFSSDPQAVAKLGFGAPLRQSRPQKIKDFPKVTQAKAGRQSRALPTGAQPPAALSLEG